MFISAYKRSLFAIRPIIASLQAPCKLHPCKNGGTCYPANEKYDFKCACASGFSGKTCDMGKKYIVVIQKDQVLRGTGNCQKVVKYNNLKPN